jgi:hypothetical protein
VREAAVWAAAEARKRELAARAAAEALEREALEKSAAAARERAAAEKAAAEAQEREAAAKAAARARQQAGQPDADAGGQDRATRAAAEAREREAAEKSAAAEREREAIARAQADARRREVADKATAEAAQRQAAEKSAAEARQRDNELQALAEARRKEAERSDITMVPGMRPAAPAESVRDPALEFASAYRSQAKARTSSAPEPMPAASSSAPPRSGAGKSKTVPVIIGAVVLGLGLATWFFVVRSQHQKQCQEFLAQAQSAVATNDFDKATSFATQAADVCAGDQQAQLSTLNTTIQTGREQAKLCDATESKAKDLLGQGLPAQASAVLFEAHADCAGRPSFSQLVKQPAEAQTDARNLIVRATSLVQANALDDAQKLIDQALALDTDVPDAQKLLIKMAAKRGKLPSRP